MPFTATAAYDAHEEGHPIYIQQPVARHIILQHATTNPNDMWVEFLTDKGERTQYDAWDVLGWLGY